MDAVKLQSLISVVNMPGYAVILETFEEAVKELEREVFNIDPSDTARIVAAARVAVGAEWILRKTEKRIAQLTTPASGTQKALTRAEEELLYLKSLGVSDGNISESVGWHPTR